MASSMLASQKHLVGAKSLGCYPQKPRFRIGGSDHLMIFLEVAEPEGSAKHSRRYKFLVQLHHPSVVLVVTPQLPRLGLPSLVQWFLPEPLL